MDTLYLVDTVLCCSDSLSDGRTYASSFWECHQLLWGLSTAKQSSLTQGYLSPLAWRQSTTNDMLILGSKGQNLHPILGQFWRALWDIVLQDGLAQFLPLFPSPFDPWCWSWEAVLIKPCADLSLWVCFSGPLLPQVETAQPGRRGGVGRFDFRPRLFVASPGNKAQFKKNCF